MQVNHDALELFCVAAPILLGLLAFCMKMAIKEDKKERSESDGAS